MNKDENDFKTVPEPGIDTLWKCFRMQVGISKDREWLGSRVRPDGTLGEYQWKTWNEVDRLVESLAKGYQYYDLLPEVEGDGRKWKFLGILAKNRWEWAVSELASVRQSGTTIAFYDALGPQAIE